MEWLVSKDPIIACSSGATENTAISVIRISGIEKLVDLQEFFTKDLNKVEPNRAYLSKIVSNDRYLDEILFTYFKAPNSFNGESILELSVHGNPLNIKNIIGLFNSVGIRNANPGEISYRALRNNKLTMSQVEGLDTLLNANSTDIIEQGLKNLGGALQREFIKLRELYLHLRGSVEILIDFSDDVGEEDSLKNLRRSFEDFFNFISKLEQRTKTPRNHLLKPKVVLIGKTNAGKSTLFNKLLNNERAIVSEIHGTTRDYVTEYFDASGVEFQLVDTAGLRESEDQIEVQGIRLSKELYNDAFFKILVVNPVDSSEFLPQDLPPDAVIFTHSDNPDFDSKLSDYKDLCKDIACFHSGSIGPDVVFGPIGPGFKIGPIGPKQGGPIEPLKPIKDHIFNKYRGLTKTNPILPERQRNNIKDLYKKVEYLSQVLLTQGDMGIISSEINNLDESVNALLGITTPDDVLNNIFSNFCIGK
ncbi:MAG: hypothetical protein CME70_07505 [Halobacteriovorax sp.]|nr:hypothetical protein [Halobacteriovorax sp.]|tara:strand:- start:338459 stop:339883 length:1425 start_codon:yes stop_codon:yes gene_type:complete